MILSFHPMFVGDANRLCAGRDPDAADRAALARAAAVILPQGCRESLYRMARETCPLLFPDYTARFRYPGKTGQVRLFQDIGVPHPETRVFDFPADFREAATHPDFPPGGYPAVFKLDGGGEGENVWRLDGPSDLAGAFVAAERADGDGRSGFLVQRWIPGGHRTLRVAAIGDTLRSYWRIQSAGDRFGAGVSGGARLDWDAFPERQRRGRAAVRRFMERTGINLAGFDLLFADDTPLFLEINYFFGRRGLGGSEAYYRLLIAAIERWLVAQGLTPPVQHGGDF